jgi:RNA-splicing ligase RtcB
MTLHRFAARRDANEPEIRSRFAHHGWHTEALSGTGMPDLLCLGDIQPLAWRRSTHPHVRQVVLVDVKTPKGGFKPAQEKKWTALRAKGIPVYIARTADDVDAIVAGTAEAWAPRTLAAVTADAGRPLHVARAPGKGSRSVRRNYTPPRSKPVDAAKEAEETFAPAHFDGCAWYVGGPCSKGCG